MVDFSKFNSLISLINYFKSEETCIKFLEQQRWNKQVVCPYCGEIIPKDSDTLFWVGAHVEDKQGNNYITPTCNECNNTYKNSKAEEKWFDVIERHLYPLH